MRGIKFLLSYLFVSTLAYSGYSQDVVRHPQGVVEFRHCLAHKNHKLGTEAKVWTYNVKFGTFSKLSKLFQTISAMRADVLGVQEISQHDMRGAIDDMPLKIARTFGYCGIFAPTLDYAPFIRMGNAIFAKSPIKNFQVIQLSKSQLIPYKEGRNVIMVNLGSIWAGVTHLSVDPNQRKSEVGALIRFLKKFESRVFVGDFNSTPGSLEINSIQNSGITPVETHLMTFPSSGPRFKFDFGFSDFPALNPTTLNSVASDHLPLGFQIQLPGK